MAEWKGVPYFFDASGELQKQVSVVVGKIPQVIVETSFSWETVISAFFAALIPSFIAWYALKNNYKLAEYQNNLTHKKELVFNIRESVSEYVTNIALLINSISMLQTNSKFENGECVGFYDIDIRDSLIKNAEGYEIKTELNKNKIILLLDELDGKNKNIFDILITINNLTETMKEKYLTPDELEINKVQENLKYLLVSTKVITLDLLGVRGI